MEVSIDHLLKLQDEEKDRQYFPKVSKDLEEEEDDIFMPFTGNTLPERNLPSRVRQENVRRYPQRERQPPKKQVYSIPSSLNYFSYCMSLSKCNFSELFLYTMPLIFVKSFLVLSKWEGMWYSL